MSALLCLAALAYAFVAVKQSAYDAKPLFHSLADYVRLFAAAAGSGAAAVVLGFLAYWQPQEH